MNNELSPRGEAAFGIFLLVLAAAEWLTRNKLSWYKAQPVDPWQSKAAFWGFLLVGGFLIAHAILRKVR